MSARREPVLRPCPSVERFLTGRGDLYLLPANDADQLLVGDPWGAVLERALASCEAGRTMSEIITAAGPSERAGLRPLLEALIEAGILRDDDALGNWDVDGPFDRQQRYFAQCGVGPVSAQSRLGSSRVMVIGVGGMGGFVADTLARAGVGALVLVDDDVVGAENLGRQPLYEPADIGGPKVAAAARRLAAISPTTQILSVLTRVDCSDAAARLVSTHVPDIVVGCADTPPGAITRWIESACRTYGVASIGGGQRLPTVTVGPLFVPGESACSACFEDDQPDAIASELERARASSTFHVPALGCADMVAAGLVARDAIAYLAGLSHQPLRSRRTTIDLHDLHLTSAGPVETCRECAASLPAAA